LLVQLSMKKLVEWWKRQLLPVVADHSWSWVMDGHCIWSQTQGRVWMT
jgi:hypothetical protein